MQILLQELLKASRATVSDPDWPARQREALGLLPDLSPEDVAAITPFFRQAVALGVFPADGGGRQAAEADVEFLSVAGKLPANTNPDAFWDYAPLQQAMTSVGNP